MMAAEDMTVAVGGYDSQGVFRGNYNLIEAVTRINLDSTSSAGAGLACRYRLLSDMADRVERQNQGTS